MKLLTRILAIVAILILGSLAAAIFYSKSLMDLFYS